MTMTMTLTVINMASHVEEAKHVLWYHMSTFVDAVQKGIVHVLDE
jgi:hypothetical protein